jgi:hypothetical protein
VQHLTHHFLCIRVITAMARPPVVDGGYGPQIWRVGKNILNLQSRTTDKGWSSRFLFGRGANDCSQ